MIWAHCWPLSGPAAARSSTPKYLEDDCPLTELDGAGEPRPALLRSGRLQPEYATVLANVTH